MTSHRGDGLIRVILVKYHLCLENSCFMDHVVFPTSWGVNQLIGFLLVLLLSCYAGAPLCYLNSLDKAISCRGILRHRRYCHSLFIHSSDIWHPRHTIAEHEEGNCEMHK